MDLLSETPRMFPLEANQRLAVRLRESLADGIMETMIGWLGERLNPSNRTNIIASRARNKLNKSLAYFEEKVSDFAGAIDAGSISLACALSYLDFRFAEIGWRDGRSKLSSWHATFAERPSMQSTAFKDG
jgi:glutathione S-transferase